MLQSRIAPKNFARVRPLRHPATVVVVWLLPLVALVGALRLDCASRDRPGYSRTNMAVHLPFPRIMHRSSLVRGTLVAALLALVSPSVAVSAQQPDSIPGVDERFVRAPRPTAPVVQPGACPFECCRYGEWKLRGAAAVRKRPSEAAPKWFGLNRGQAVFADSGFVQIDTIGLVVIRKRYLDAMYRTPYGAGDTLLVLDYIGEGQYNAWWRGYAIEAEAFWDSLGQSPGPKTVGTMVRQERTRWWAHVRDRRGRRGWIDMNKVGVSGADACG